MSVTVGEGTSLNVLTRETDLITLIDQCCESESLCSAPIDTFTFFDGLLTSFENLDNLIVELTTISWEFGNFFANLVEDFEINTGVISVVELFISLDLCPLLSHPLLLVKLECLTLKVGLFHLCLTFIFNSLQIFLGDTLLDKLRTILISARCHFVDNFVHKRLGEGRLIKLVVTEFPISNQVDDDITAKLLSELGSEFKSALDIFHAISVDMENGRVDSFCDIRRVPS